MFHQDLLLTTSSTPLRSWSVIVVVSAMQIAFYANAVQAETLVFSDDFEREELGDDWISIGATDFDLVGGRLRATENGQTLNSVMTFSGDLRIELDIEKVGLSNHTAWDLAIGIIRLPPGTTTLGAIRFDQDGVDAIGIGSDTQAIRSATNPPSIPADSPNRGRVIFTSVDSQVNFRYTNANGDMLVTSTQNLPIDEPFQLYINVAAHPDSPRYVDNLRVYSLAFPEPSGMVIALLGLIFIPRTGLHHTGRSIQKSS